MATLMIATPHKLSRSTTRVFPLRASVCLLLLVWGVAPAAGQTTYFFQPAPGDAEIDRLWQNPNHWQNPLVPSDIFVPNAEFNESAIINNGATAVLTVDMPNSGVDSVVTPGEITVSNGGLDIRSTGALHSEIFTSSNGTSSGNVTIGGGGNALLQVSAGGSLVADGELVFEDDNAGYQVEITGLGSSGFVDVAGPAELNGSLSLQFNGYQPMVGNSWTVMEAGGFTGGFSSISSTGDLAYNQAIVVGQADLGGGRFGINAQVEEVLVLEVNRDSGEVKLTHPGTSSITLDGYYIGSDSGLLSDNPSDWTSLTEGGQLGNDWIETDQTPSNIAELKIGPDATFGSDISLGNIYNPFAGQFGVNVEDLTFGFHRISDSAQFPGVVRYTGSKANTLVLQVDPNGTGDAFLRNTSNTTVQIDAYEILADDDLLSEAGWNSLDEQDGPGDVWLEGLDNGPRLLAEFDAEGFTTISPGDSWNLGPLFSGGTEGLDFNFLMRGEEESSPGIVVYEAFVGLAGDFDHDGDVDGDDFLLWQRGGSPNPLSADDLSDWEANYGISSNNPLAAANQAVPEPATGLLFVLFAFVGSCRRSPRRV